MKITKMFLLFIVAMFLAVSAWGSGIPEFDAVGIDAENIYANDLAYKQIIANGQSNQNANLNDNYFDSTSPVNDMNPCNGQMASMTSPGYGAQYEWQIMLQASPDSDINLKIHDCIECTECGTSDFWQNAAEQTGRATWDYMGRVWVKGANPSMTVRAWPGAYAEPGFNHEFIMDARKLPGLGTHGNDMCEQLYTSKGNFSEGIVLIRPGGGICGSNGGINSQLSAGDVIQVIVDIPQSINPHNIYYGKDDVILEYVGVAGSDIP